MNSVTQFIIHIGPHKTGTTYLQLTLEALRNTLLDQGVYVPAEWNAAPDLPSHMQLVWAIRSKNLSLLERQVREILARRPQSVVISCEGLSRFNQDELVQLRTLLAPAPVQVVYYVRRWPERIASLWQERVKFGHTETFPGFLAEQLVDFDSSELRDTTIIDKFSAIFGASQLKLISYSHLVDMNIDIAGQFLSACFNLSDIVLPITGHPNQSLPILETELIRALNVIHMRRGGEPSPAVRNWFLTHRKGLLPDSLLDAMRYSLTTIRLDEAATPFSRTIEDLLHRYAPSIVLPHHPEGLHELQSIEAPFVRSDYLLEPGVTKILTDIYEMYRCGSVPFNENK